MIYLIFTTCIHNKHGPVNSEKRKENYLESIQRTLSILPEGIKPIIVENNGKRSTFLDEINIDVLYTDHNTGPHKPVNELLDIQAVINHYNMTEDDTIIKLTGRYCPLDNSFFHTVLGHPEYDACVKFFNVCTREYNDYDSVLGMFALKCKYMKQFHYNEETLGRVSCEMQFATFIRNNIDSKRLLCVDMLQLRCISLDYASSGYLDV